jgi:hypothetical protein
MIRSWKLETHQPRTVEEFTRAVYRAEGMDPISRIAGCIVK